MELYIVVGVLVLTFWSSRLWFAVLGSRLSPMLTMLAAHTASFAILALAIGLGRAYFTAFATNEVLPYAVGQLFWLAVDVQRARMAAAR